MLLETCTLLRSCPVMSHTEHFFRKFLYDRRVHRLEEQLHTKTYLNRQVVAEIVRELWYRNQTWAAPQLTRKSCRRFYDHGTGLPLKPFKVNRCYYLKKDSDREWNRRWGPVAPLTGSVARCRGRIKGKNCIFVSDRWCLRSCSRQPDSSSEERENRR